DSQHVSRLLHPPTPGAYMTRRAKARPEIRARHTPGGRSGEGYGSATVSADSSLRAAILGTSAGRRGRWSPRSTSTARSPARRAAPAAGAGPAPAGGGGGGAARGGRRAGRETARAGPAGA